MLLLKKVSLFIWFTYVVGYFLNNQTDDAGSKILFIYYNTVSKSYLPYNDLVHKLHESWQQQNMNIP